MRMFVRVLILLVISVSGVWGFFATAQEADLAQSTGNSTASVDVSSKALEFVKRVDWTAEAAPGILLVGFEPGAKSQQKSAAHSAVGAKVLNSFDLIPVDVVEIPAKSTLQETAEFYARQPGVAYVEPNHVYHLGAVSNDPDYDVCWGLEKIKCPIAWNSTTGSKSVIVAVIDSGVDYNHPDLAANMWTNGSGQHGITCINGNGTITSNDPMDFSGHGTHCAGTIGAVGNNGTGVVGVNWSVRIIALRFMKLVNGSWTGYDADAIRCLEFAKANGASLTSNSWGGVGSPSNHQALNSAIEASGMLFVASAGNEGRNNDDGRQFPSSLDSANIIAVANSDPSDNRNSSSNYGHFTVDLAAPGTGIYSTVPNGDYEGKTGTSMAAPHVAGVAALILSTNPGMSVANLKQRILGAVDPLPQWNGLCVTGGRLNAARAVSNQGDDAYEPNNSRLTAYDWRAGSQTWLTNVAGNGVQWDEDWYKIQVGFSGTAALAVDCQFEHSKGDIEIELYDSFGMRLAGSAGGSDREFIQYPNPTPGIYYIRVYGEGRGNLYNLLWYDAPSVTFSTLTQTALEGSGSVQLLVQLSRLPGPGKSVSIDVVPNGGTAIVGQDYSLSSGGVVFQGAETQKAFTVNILDDFAVESVENAGLALTNPQYCILGTSNLQATLTINDNDTLVNGARAFASYKNSWYTGASLYAPVSTAIYGGSVGGVSDGVLRLSRSAFGMPVSGWANLSLLSTLSDGPTVTVNQAVSQSDPTSSCPVQFDIVFPEAVTGFDSDDSDDVDIDFSEGTLGATDYTISGGPAVYTLTVNSVNGDEGTLIATVPAGVCKNSGNVPNSPSSSVDNFVVIDSTAPETGVVISATGPFTADRTMLTFLWSGFVDLLTGISGYEVALGTPGNPEAFSSFESVSSDSSSHTFQNGPYTPGVYRCSVRATNGSGLETVSFADITVSDNTPTGGVVVSDTGQWTNQSSQLSFSWSGFTSNSDITGYEVSLSQSGAPLNFIPVGTVNSYVFSGSWIETEYVCTVRATSGTGESATASASVTVDVTPPSVKILDLTHSPTASDIIEFSVSFDEPVTSTFTPDDISQTGSASTVGIVGITGTDPEYVVTCTAADPNADGTVGISLMGIGVTDRAGNSCADAFSGLVEVFNWRGFKADLTDSRTYTGAPLTLTVTPDCDAPGLVYQWKRDQGSGVSPVGTNESQLVILPTIPGSSGEYWCEVAYDGQIHASQHATVTIRDHLSAVEGRRDLRARLNEPSTVSDFVSGGFEPLAYQWFKDGVEISSATSETFSIGSISESDKGFYTVFVTDDLGEEVMSGGVELTVITVTAEFTADRVTGGSPLRVQFLDQSTSLSDITGWEWDFGDPGSGVLNTSSEQNPAHSYSTPGIYSVSLVASNVEMSDTKTKSDFITVIPVYRLYVPFYSDNNITGIDDENANEVATMLYVQNTSDQPAQLSISYSSPSGEQANPGDAPAQYILGGRQLLAWRPSKNDALEVQPNGAVPNSVSPKFNGSVLIESTKQVAGCVISYDFVSTSFEGGVNSERDIAAYTMPNGGGAKLYVPHFVDFGPARKQPLLLSPNKNTGTFIAVQNIGETQLSFDTSYHLPIGQDITRADGSPYLLLPGSGVSWRPSYDTADQGVGVSVRDATDKKGGVLVSAPGTNDRLAGRVQRNDYDRGSVAMYELPGEATANLFAPFFSDPGAAINSSPGSGVATFLAVQNVTGSEVQMNVAYVNANGQSINDATVAYTIKPFSSVTWRPYKQLFNPNDPNEFNDPAEGVEGKKVPNSTAANGAAIISANGSVVGQVIAFDNDPSARANAAYTMPGTGSLKLAVPIFMDNGTFHVNNPVPASEYATFIGVQNVSDTSVQLTVKYYDSQGTDITKAPEAGDQVPYTIEAHSTVAWRPFSDPSGNVPNGENPTTGGRVLGSTQPIGTAILEATGPIVGRVLIYDYKHFGERGMAAYTLTDAEQAPSK